MMLALDPGIRGCGVAAFAGSSLAWAAYVRNPIRGGAGADARRAAGDRRERILARVGVHAVREMARAVWAALPGGVRADRLVVEWPQIYTYGKGRGDPNDLLALVGVGSALAALIPEAAVESVRPRAWKGTVPGDAMVERIQALVTAGERLAVDLPCASLSHNVWDAVGIGLWRVGRLTRHRVVARE